MRGVPALPPGKIHNLTSETFDTPTQRWWLTEDEKQIGQLVVHDFIQSLFWSSFGFLLFFFFKLSSPIFCLTVYPQGENGLSLS